MVLAELKEQKMQANQTEQDLKAAIGQHVRLVNETDIEGLRDRVRLHVHGTLDRDDTEYFVFIGQDPNGHGSNSVGFSPDEVTEVFRQSSGIWVISVLG